jgi:hypothetical protein
MTIDAALDAVLVGRLDALLLRLVEDGADPADAALVVEAQQAVDATWRTAALEQLRAAAGSRVAQRPQSGEDRVPHEPRN